MNESEKELHDRTVKEYENAGNMIGLYAFYDIVSSRYDIPFSCKNDINAKRHFIMTIDKDGTILNKFQTEFSLHRLGFFDLFSSEFIEWQEVLITGNEYKKGDK